MPSGTRALIAFNPAAGRHPRRRLRQLAGLQQALAQGGWRLDLAATDPIIGAAAAARRGVEERYDVLIACGGDGTLHQIAQVLAAAPRPVPALAVAPPFGTANILAHALHCPSTPARAAQWLLRAHPRPLPLGLAETPSGSRHFVAIASVGYDAAIVRDLSLEAKRRWGKLAFAARAATAWRSYFPAPLDFTASGTPDRADGLFFSLTPFYAGHLRLGQPGQDGTLALALRGAPRLLPFQALALASFGLEHAPGIARLPPGPIAIPTSGLPLELDGEPAGTTPIALSLAPSSLTILANPVPITLATGN